MSNDIPITVVGNLTADPVIREYEGKRFGGFTLGSTPRYFDRQSNTWKDGTPTFMPVNITDAQVRALEAARIGKGSGVIVKGTMKTRGWTDRETQKPRSRVEMHAESIGLLLLPPRRDDAGGQGGGMRPGTAGDQPWSGQQGGQPQGDAWQGDQGQFDDETPF